MELLQEIESYWTTRTEGYSEVNQKELAGMQKQAWLDVLTDHFPKKEKCGRTVRKNTVFCRFFG